MNIHLFPDEKFTYPYIEFINSNFDLNQHLFLIIGRRVDINKISVNHRKNVRVISSDFRSIITLILGLYRCDKIFLHGLFIKEVNILLFLQPWLLKKSNWLIWGGDLYKYNFKHNNLKSRIDEFVRRFVIRKMSGFITHIKGDYELAKKWYRAKGKYYYSFMYPSNLFHEFDLPKDKEDMGKTFIQVGNSADPSNNHLEIFEWLKKYKNEDIEIICPLSYGNSKYKQEIIKKGEEIFSSKFKPIIDFMPFQEYLKYLGMVDIAIFNHQRQQAMGNITTLLGLGKKVYIRDDITTWEFCVNYNLKVFNLNERDRDLLDKMSNFDRERNVSIIKSNFSENNLKKDWELIFSEGK